MEYTSEIHSKITSAGKISEDTSEIPLTLLIIHRSTVTIVYGVYRTTHIPFQRHLLKADTLTVIITVLVIEWYLAVRSAYRPVCKAIGETDQLEQLDALTTQSEILASMMTRLEALELVSKEASPVPWYRYM